jgi:hypothetical protein
VLACLLCGFGLDLGAGGLQLDRGVELRDVHASSVGHVSELNQTMISSWSIRYP